MAFRLPATNGYTATFIAGFNPAAEESGAIVLLRDKHGAATYATSSAQVGETAVDASFGALGEVDVHLVPTVGTTTERPRCGGKPVSFPAGRWEGTIRFRGEEGFAGFEATSAKYVVGPLLDLLCGEGLDEGIGGHSPGALLDVRRRHGDEALELSVRKNKRVGPVRIKVEETEHRGDLSIDRSIASVGPSKAFDFEIPPGRATVAPPDPFTGSLSLTRRPGSSPLVTGDLEVDLPGRRAVPVLGPGSLRASLVRAVLNPSHPF
jgi:hypothetical protein